MKISHDVFLSLLLVLVEFLVQNFVELDDEVFDIGLVKYNVKASIYFSPKKFRGLHVGADVEGKYIFVFFFAYTEIFDFNVGVILSGFVFESFGKSCGEKITEVFELMLSHDCFGYDVILFFAHGSKGDLQFIISLVSKE
jgi:hypothetical protein